MTNPLGTRGQQSSNSRRAYTISQGAFCQYCSAWIGHLGLEKAPWCDASLRGEDCGDQCYLGHLLLVCDGVWRILRDDGVLCWNCGDSYCSTDKWGGGKSGNSGKHTVSDNGQVPSWAVRAKHQPVPGLKPKNLMNIPARFSIAMQARGWILRSAFDWIKTASMPESVTDRPSTSTERMFIFTKRAAYYWDADAVRTPLAHANAQRTTSYETFGRGPRDGGNQGLDGLAARMRNGEHNGRNRRTGDWWMESLDALIADTEAWLAHAKQVKAHGGLLLSPEGEPLGLKVNPQPFSGSHFAVFPEALVRPLIQASTSERGCCGKCQAPWARVTEKIGEQQSRWSAANSLASEVGGTHRERTHQNVMGTIAWEPQCACGGYRIRSTTSRRLQRHPWYRQHWQARIEARWPAVEPCVVADPFLGSGTTCVGARSLARKSVGVELSAEYLDMAKNRLSANLPLLEDVPAISPNGPHATQEVMTFDA